MKTVGNYRRHAVRHQQWSYGGLRILLSLFCLIVPASLFAVEAQDTFLVIESGMHDGTIKLAIASDGSKVVTTGRDKTLRVWDVSQREEPRVIRTQIGPGDVGTPHTIAISPNGEQVAFAGRLSDQTEVRLVNLERPRVYRSLTRKGNHTVHAAKFSPDGRFIAVNSDESLVIWEVKTGRFFSSISPEYKIVAFQFSENSKEHFIDGKHTDREERRVDRWNLATGKRVANVLRYTGEDAKQGLVVTPGGKYFLRVPLQHKGKKIDIHDSNGRWKAAIDLRTPVRNGTYSSDGKTAVLTTDNGFVVVSLVKGRVTYRHEGYLGKRASVSNNGLIAFGDRSLVVFDTKRKKVILKVDQKAKSVGDVAFSTYGDAIAWSDREGILTDRLVIGKNRLEHQSADLDEKEYIFEIDRVGPVSVKRIDSKLKIYYKGEERKTPYGWQAGVTLTPDGKHILRGQGWAYLQEVDLEGKIVKRFIGHSGEVWDLAPSPDSRLFVSGALDNTVRLWDIASEKLLLTVFQGKDGEWVAWTPEGYYDASVNGEKYIGWHINQGADKPPLFYPASRFSKKFYAPRVVANYVRTSGDLEEAIRLANAGAARRDHKQVVTTEAFRKAFPPVVYFQEPASRSLDLSADRLTIRGQARSVSGEAIRDIWVTLNGTRIDRLRGIRVKPQQGKSLGGQRAVIELTLKLTEPVNRIALYAETDQARSEPEVITVRLKAGPQSEDIYKPDLYLLSIGVSKYRDSQFDLDLAHKDALGLAEMFKMQKDKLYRRVHTKVLLNQEATKGEVLDGLDWLSQAVTQRDVAVIFVAGHGLKDNLGSYYFLPHDGKPDKLRRTAVKWIDFQDVVTNLPSKTLFLIDTCHSGSVTGKRRSVEDMTDAVKELVQADAGLVVMTASTGREFSAEKAEWGHGAFTKALIDGLRGNADFNRNGQVEIKELDLYVTEQVKKLTGGTQHPTTEIPRTLPNFPVALQ